MACTGAGGWARGEEPAPANVDAQADEDRERSAVEALGEKKGLRPFRSSRTANFLGIGDAPDDFRAMTLRDCEAVTADYLDHYRAKGFDVAPGAAADGGDPGRRPVIRRLPGGWEVRAEGEQAADRERPRHVHAGDESARLSSITARWVPVS